MAFFFSITRHTSEFPDMLKVIVAAKNTTYTRELIESAILWFEIFSESRRYLYMLAKEAQQSFEYLFIYYYGLKISQSPEKSIKHALTD